MDTSWFYNNSGFCLGSAGGPWYPQIQHPCFQVFAVWQIPGESFKKVGNEKETTRNSCPYCCIFRPAGSSGLQPLSGHAKAPPFTQTAPQQIQISDDQLIVGHLNSGDPEHNQNNDCSLFFGPSLNNTARQSPLIRTTSV